MTLNVLQQNTIADRSWQTTPESASPSRFSILAPLFFFFSPSHSTPGRTCFRLMTSRAERGRSGNVKRRSGSGVPPGVARRYRRSGRSASRARGCARTCARARSPSGSRRRSAAFACSPAPRDRRPARRSPASPSSGWSRSRCHGSPRYPRSLPGCSPASSPAASSLRIGGRGGIRLTDWTYVHEATRRATYGG